MTATDTFRNSFNFGRRGMIYWNQEKTKEKHRVRRRQAPVLNQGSRKTPQPPLKGGCYVDAHDTAWKTAPGLAADRPHDRHRTARSWMGHRRGLRRHGLHAHLASAHRVFVRTAARGVGPPARILAGSLLREARSALRMPAGSPEAQRAYPGFSCGRRPAPFLFSPLSPALAFPLLFPSLC